MKNRGRWEHRESWPPSPADRAWNQSWNQAPYPDYYSGQPSSLSYGWQNKFRPQRPRSIQAAVALMCVGAGLAAFGVILNLIDSRGLVVGYGATSPQTDALGIADAAGSAIGSFVAIVLWLWMAAANNAGRSWARVTATVLFAINTVDLAALLLALRAVSHHASVFGGSLSQMGHIAVLEAAGIWILGLAIIVLLWSGASSEYYAAMKGFDY